MIKCLSYFFLGVNAAHYILKELSCLGSVICESTLTLVESQITEWIQTIAGPHKNANLEMCMCVSTYGRKKSEEGRGWRGGWSQHWLTPVCAASRWPGPTVGFEGRCMGLGWGGRFREGGAHLAPRLPFAALGALAVASADMPTRYLHIEIVCSILKLCSYVKIVRRGARQWLTGWSHAQKSTCACFHCHHVVIFLAFPLSVWA